MPRSNQQLAPPDPALAAGGEWQALRGELVELLDAVEDSYAKADQRDPRFDTLARRVKELREQVGVGDARHREALKSVQKAVTRFSDRDDSATTAAPVDALQAAIYEIRSRQGARPRVPEIADANAEELARDAELRRAADVRERLRNAEEQTRKTTMESMRQAAEAEARKATQEAVRRAEDAATRTAEAVAQRTSESLVQRTVEVTAQRTAEAVALRTAEAMMKKSAETTEAQRRTNAEHFGQLAGAVGSLSSRLEQLEGALKTQTGGTQTSVREISDQVGQLSQMVEMLAGAVGETGQVKRLETQIADIADLVKGAPKVDLSTLNSRLDELAMTVERLSELQVEQLDRARQPKPDMTADIKADLKTGMAAIESSVRNVYDRIDAVERSLALTPAEIEKLTGTMSKFTEALQDHDAQPKSLVPLIDALNTRLHEIEGRDTTVADLKQEVGALRLALGATMEPRFAALETKLDELTDRVVASAAIEMPTTDALEEQIRRLVERMDETGAQLGGLARLYSDADTRTAAPDYDHLAALVAEKTSAAVARSVPVPGPSFNDDAFDEIERRMSSLFRSQDQAPVAVSVMEDGIRRVDERLARLEEALRDVAHLKPMAAPDYHEIAALVAQKTSEAVNRVAPRATEPPQELARAAPPADSRDAGVADAPRNSRRVDTMPANPGDDAPLTDRPALPTPLQSALEAKLVAPSRPQAARPMAPTDFDPGSVPRPPRPESTLSTSSDPFATPTLKPSDSLRGTSPEVSATTSSRNTFIEAARRAAQRQSSGKDAANNSLIGRALARFQGTETAEMPATLKSDITAGAENVAKPAKLSRAQRKHQLAESKAAETITILPEVGVPSVATDADAALRDVGKQPSFLLRHRQPILLAASIVAVSLLALNFVSQQMRPAVEIAAPASAMDISAPVEPILDATVPVDIAPVDDAPAAQTPTAVPDTSYLETEDAPTAPRVIPITDSLAVGSISPAAMGFKASGQVIPSAIVPPLDGAELPVLTDAAVDTVPANGFELAPEALGPIDLRQAAAGGDAKAQFEVAAIFTEGSVVPQDYAEAAIWYERAAAQGFAPAEYRLASLYEAGKGVEKDLESARLWYQRAAEAGNRMSMHNLAALYASGSLGEQEFESAAQWFEQAATRGMTDSQFNLGMLYARGLGVPQSLEDSFKWFSIAARNGDADAIKARDDIAKSLDAEAVARINAIVGTWNPEAIDLVANFAPIGTWSPTFDPGVVIDNKDVVTKVQAALTKLGYDVGVPDGLAGPKTAEAIKAFEKSTGMSESGAINPRLLAVLGSQPV